MKLWPYLLPSFCAVCHIKTLNHDYPHICNHCYAALNVPIKKCIFCDTSGAFLCHFCKQVSPKLQKIIISFQYNSGIQALIQQLKFSLKPYLAKSIAQIIWQKNQDFIAQLPDNTIIIPMPSGRLRVAKRGYNPVSLIATELSRLSNLPAIDHFLLKAAFSVPQVELSRIDRLDNHHNSFWINPRFDRSRLPIENILLLDDVITTGRSFEKAAEKLHESSAKQIFGLFIAQS